MMKVKSVELVLLLSYFSTLTTTYSFLSNQDLIESQSKLEYIETKLISLTEDIAELKKKSYSYSRCSFIDDQLELAKGEERPRTSRSSTRQLQGRSINRRSLSGASGSISYLKGDPGEPGRNGLDGVPGLDGAPGLDGVPGIDGRNGKDGMPGKDGRDGKDGKVGERGPIGPPGVTGESGRRGKPGPAGKTGAPGSPGICAYQAKFNCSRHTDTDDRLKALLSPPTIIGRDGELGVGERVVSVNEGDNIQLSCEAFGLPKPEYSWHRSDRKLPILLDAFSGMKVSSYPGGQLPLVNVDRAQAGDYQCVASNGVPPVALKMINLEVNYAPTIRIYPSPSSYRVEFGANLLIECIVEANPSPLIYWTHGSSSLMSIGPQQNVQKMKHENASGRKFSITESVGQLTSGAFYSILTLNLTILGPIDLGLYRCVGRNLIGQTVGYALVESSQLVSAGRAEEGENYGELILDKSRNNRLLDYALGWPDYLLERRTNYTTFGYERLSNTSVKYPVLPLRIPFVDSSSVYGANETLLIKPVLSVSGENGSVRLVGEQTRLKINQLDASEMDEDEEAEMCWAEGQKFEPGRSLMLLDQVGKPVYLGSVVAESLAWWSLDARPRNDTEKDLDQSIVASSYYATSSIAPNKLLEYANLADLLDDHQESRPSATRAVRIHQLGHSPYGNSYLIHSGVFYYSFLIDQASKSQNLDGLRIAAYNLKQNRYTYLSLSGNISALSAEQQPLDLGSEYRMNRLEFCLDESGTWLIIPTIEQKSGMVLGGQYTRRLHVFKLRSTEALVGDNIAIDYHVSMKLDWRMIGQLFIIDGVLYGIKDRHTYTSKLQFAYHLYKCKLLSKDYLNEPQRAFTNHFGNTLMIKYNPNEPKRLYTIDNGNLLWCPVKLIKTNPDDIWQQQHTIRDNSINN